LWVGLVTYVDDYGRGDARPAIIKGTVFPLRERITLKDIERGLLDLAGAGCVILYKVDGKPYLYFPKWDSHQRIQTKRSKFPPPVSTVNHGEQPPESESESESESEDISPEQTGDAGSSVPQSAPEKQEPVITLTLNDKSEYPIYEEQCHEWAGLYPAVDVIQQLRAMKGWLNANPKQRKTKAGILKFVNGWLAREQDRGGSTKTAQRSPGKLRDTQAPPSYDIDKFMEWNEREMFGAEPVKGEG
jgi:hypothetical protein